jgi:hypothetical protein
LQTGEAPQWARYLPLAVLVVILTIRYIRPMRISVTRMWIGPIVLCGLTAFAIYAGESLNPAPAWQIAIGLVIGFVAGVPFGVLRGMHTDVRPTERKGVMYLGSSWVTMAIFIGAFALRYGIRSALPQHGAIASVVGDGLLAFAIAFVAVSYVVIFRKYETAVASAR